MTKHLRRLLPVFIALAALALSACGGSSDTAAGPADNASAAPASPELQKLIDAAKKEGSVTWYSSATENVAQRVSQAFQDKYGIKTEYVRASSPDLIQRYSAEADAGRVAADAGVFPANAFIPEGVKKGWFVPVKDAGIPVIDDGTYPKDRILSGGDEAVAQLLPWYVAYNTQVVGKDQVPKTWDALLDPQWKGKIIMPDLKSSAVYVRALDRASQEYGADFVQRLGAQKPKIAESGAPAIQALAAGEAAVMPLTVGSLVNPLKAQGAPVDMFLLPHNTASTLAIGVSKKASHPNAARLLVDYMLSKEGSAVFNKEPGEVSPYAKPGSGGLPEDYKPEDPKADAKLDEYEAALKG